MKVNKQTLFPISNGMRDAVYLYDLKTLTLLAFKSYKETLKFCTTYNESECVHDLQTDKLYRCKYLYLSTNNRNKQHTVVNVHYNSHIKYISSKELLFLVKCDDVINLSMGNKGKIRVDWIVPQVNKEFKEMVDNQYKNYISNTKLFKDSPEFEYIIIGENVIQINAYNSDNVFVPEFVTSVSTFKQYPKLLKISDGVKFIGSEVINKDTQLLGGKNLKYIGNMERLTNVQIIQR